MNCTVCKNAMIVLELQDVEIDYCPQCKGIWLDAGELERLLADVQKTRELMDSFALDKKSGELKRKCPICRKKMDKVTVGDPSKSTVLIDKCPKGDGIWFDANELQQIIDKARLDKENKIKELLGDMFSHKVEK
jgi:Zn-finger nucleic acid-binding protein